MDNADDPIAALVRDHDMVRKLADKYLNSSDMEVKKQAATQLLQAIHTHSRLEESIFYPNVRCLDDNLVRHFEQDHLKVDDLLATLQGMEADEPRAEQMMRDMLNAVLSHIEEEEQQLFPRLRQSNVDMSDIGLQMQSFEANLVHMQAQASDQGSRRR
ncbi:hemerythrin domain-containing protein [Massilia norwichensis]|jgi:hemerythrin superfamily protein|uniref:Hemerythrin domain-containing protein n=1 Tax=Massilia norwichensis TaxID=1442366 RepID=A0ABT2A4D1_9BURK|nr:hemerythrin domain-containing protein [Massilia norwichensis]MCS0589052.1 hemerythrin domain-containing protein [Massilia norwichensis]